MTDGAQDSSRSPAQGLQRVRRFGRLRGWLFLHFAPPIHKLSTSYRIACAPAHVRRCAGAVMAARADSLRRWREGGGHAGFRYVSRQKACARLYLRDGHEQACGRRFLCAEEQ